MNERERFLALLEEMKEVFQKKNHDYSSDTDPFANFKLSELVGIDPFKGLLVRLGDKYSRVCFVTTKNEIKVKEETVRDTLIDMANYALIGIVMWENQYGKDKHEQAANNNA